MLAKPGSLMMAKRWTLCGMPASKQDHLWQQHRGAADAPTAAGNWGGDDTSLHSAVQLQQPPIRLAATFATWSTFRIL